MSDDSVMSDSSGLSSPRSLSPPADFLSYTYSYPSPASDLTSLGSTPVPDGMATPPSTQGEGEGDDDDSPKPKRRKMNPPKERITSHLDLSSPSHIPQSEQDQLDKLLNVLYKKRKIVVICGAGISVSAGIPDFRSSTGLFKTLKREHGLKSSGKDLFDAAVYKDGDSTTSFHAMVRSLSTATKEAEPTAFHHLLATLAQEGRLLRLYTQNVDGIDTSLPPLQTKLPLPRRGPWPKTIQLHGTLEHMTCTKCHNIFELDPALFDGPSPPPCTHCQEADGVRTQHAGKRSHGVGVLRPRMVLYNEHNPDDEAIGSVVKADMRTRPDALIVVGTTLKVPGVKRIVKEMCGLVRDRRDGVTVWINNDPPPAMKDYEWDLIVQGPCDNVASHAKLRKWDEPEPAFVPVTEEHVEKVKRENGLECVEILSPSKRDKTFTRVQGVPTPIPSPLLKPLSLAKSDAARPAHMTRPAPGKGKRTSENNKTHTNTSKAAPKPRKQATAKPTNKKDGKVPNLKITFKASKPKAADGAKKLDAIAGLQSRPKDPKDASLHPWPMSNSSSEPSVMQPLSPSALRINSSPPHADSAAQSKWHSYKGVRSGVPAIRTSVSTPAKESREERRRTISPSIIPKGMINLLN